MTSPIGAIGTIGAGGGLANLAGAMGGVTGVTGVLPPGATPATNSTFAAAMAQGLGQVQAMQSNADTLAVQAATGDLTDVHDYMLASTQAQLATEMTVALRNKAVDAFTEIMRMQG